MDISDTLERTTSVIHPGDDQLVALSLVMLA